MTHPDHSRPSPSYTCVQWKSLTAFRQHYTVPVVFDDLLAPNLPVDGIRVLRYLWFATWGRVSPSPWMPPERVAESLTEWAGIAVTTERAYDWVYPTYDELAWVDDGYPELSRSSEYRLLKKAWAVTWDEVEDWKSTPEYADAVEQYQSDVSPTSLYKELMSPTISRLDLRAAFASRATTRLERRGRTRVSLRRTLDWLVEHRLIRKYWTGIDGVDIYEFGDEMWHVLTTGDFTPEFRDYLGTTTPASEPFFRLRREGLTPRKEGFAGVRVALGEHYDVPTAMEVLLERHLPASVMRLVSYVARNTIGRSPSEHRTLGYVRVSTKQMARLFGPAHVTAPSKRGRRVQTVRKAIDWAVEHGILDRRRTATATELSLGPEVWYAVRNGRFSPAFGSLLGAERARVKPLPHSRRAKQLDLMYASMDTMPMRDFVRIRGAVARRVDEADSLR
jgi:hypothetical protein